MPITCWLFQGIGITFFQETVLGGTRQFFFFRFRIARWIIGGLAVSNAFLHEAVFCSASQLFFGRFGGAFLICVADRGKGQAEQQTGQYFLHEVLPDENDQGINIEESDLVVKHHALLAFNKVLHTVYSSQLQNRISDSGLK